MLNGKDGCNLSGFKSLFGNSYLEVKTMSQLKRVYEILNRLAKEGKINNHIWVESAGCGSWRDFDSISGHLESRSSMGIYWSPEDYIVYVGLKKGIIGSIFPKMEEIVSEMKSDFSLLNPNISINDRGGYVDVYFGEVIAEVFVTEECRLYGGEYDLKNDQDFPGKWDGFDDQGKRIFDKEKKETFKKIRYTIDRSVNLQVYPSGRAAQGAYNKFMDERRECQESSF
jgi:hypothetical protein